MQIEDFTLLHNDYVIPFRIFTPPHADKKYCVLWLQGWSSSMDSHREGVERMAKQANTTYVTVDPAGHGLSTIPLDESTRKQQLEEVIAIFDEITKRKFDNIIVIGGSFGAYLTALLTGERPVHTAILRAPANYPDDEFEYKFKDTLRSKNYAGYTKTKESEQMLVNSSATKALARFDGYTYILEHELDEEVPSKIPKKYYEVAKHGNYLLIPNTMHSPKNMADPRAHFKYIEHIVASIIKAVRLQEELNP
jgi:pimeloyl-ACP methyl ester carboxylesterase